MHVHSLGDGSSGSGCELKLTRRMKYVAKSLCRHLDIAPNLIGRGLDEAFLRRTLQYVTESSLDAVVLLAHEHVYSDSGHRLESPMFVPNNYVLEIARSNSNILAGISIHPAREDALDELERCAEQGAVLYKCLPMCQNINCMDRRYLPFWERLAELELPLLAHTGGEGILPVTNRRYASPEYLQLPLDCGVSVIAAHFGSNCSPFDRNYLSSLLGLMDQYPNLYADISALNLPFRSRYTSRLMDEMLIKRLVHGSDFPVPAYAVFPFLRGYLSLKTYWELRGLRNPLERDYRIKQALGFPDETFSRIYELFPYKVQKRLHETA